MEASKECCVECQEQNPFFRLGGGIVGKFAYSRDTPFIQPFESIESPWTDYIKSDSLETNIKKLYKLAQKYTKTQTEKKPEEEKQKEKAKEREPVVDETKPGEKWKDKSNSPEREKPKEEETSDENAMSEAEFEVLQSQWKTECNKGTQKNKNDILVIASKLGLRTEKKNKGYDRVDKNVMKKLNKIFKTNYSL